MTLEGANNLRETNDYIIYTMNSVATGQYGVVVPKNINGTLNMLVDLHMKSSFDLVNNGSKTIDMLISEISDEYVKLRTKYSDGMLVIPMVDEVYFQNIVNNSDKQKMFDEVKKIGSITSELYKKLTSQGIDKQRIDQKIIIVEKDNCDERFVLWLKEQNGMNNFVEGIKYNEIGVSANAFVNNGNSLFGPQVDNNNGIFGTSATPSQPPVTENIQNVTPVSPVEPADVNNNSLFANQEGQVANNSNVIGNNNINNGVNATPVNSVFGPNVTEGNVSTLSGVPNQTPVVEGPKPVQSAPIEGTTTFSPVTEQQASGDVSGEESTSGDLANKSKGFVNLLILAVVLVGVTIVSIELGKYLYSVYGA